MLEDQTTCARPATDPEDRAGSVLLASCLSLSQARLPGPSRSTVPRRRSVTALLPIMGVVLVAFLVIGLALPVLPLHVHQGLDLGTFVVGLVTGSQFAASLVSCVWSGQRRALSHTRLIELTTAPARSSE